MADRNDSSSRTSEWEHTGGDTAIKNTVNSGVGVASIDHQGRGFDRPSSTGNNGRVVIDETINERVIEDGGEDNAFRESTAVANNDDIAVLSFRNGKYESAEMRSLLSLHEPEEILGVGLEHLNYEPKDVFPDWVINNQNWKLIVKANATSKSISEILKIHFSKRTPEQVSTAIHWLMSVWKIAGTMGFKRCGAMLKEFKLESYQPGDYIITEGERGLTFYIIIDGKTSVHKDGIGVVGYLGKGKSFGEIALTQGKDLRTATIIAESAVDVVSLHKDNYDYFVRDIQDQEKRENFRILSECRLFKTWPKGKIEKMSNSCVRKTFDAGSYVFHQGDDPADLCIVVEGSVEIVKELVIVCKNRWPVAVNKWKELRKRIHKPILLKTLGPTDFFGEVAILKDMPRSTSAIATSRTVLLSLDRLEFLHLISYGSNTINGNAVAEEEERFNQIINKYIDDQDILDAVSYFKGGPDSEAVVGATKVLKNELNLTKESEQLTRHKEAVVSRPKHKSKGGGGGGRQSSSAEDAKQLSYQREIENFVRGQDITQKLQATAAEVMVSEQNKEERHEAFLGPSYSSSRAAHALARRNSRQPHGSGLGGLGVGHSAQIAAGRKQRGPPTQNTFSAGAVSLYRSQPSSSSLDTRRASAIRFGMGGSGGAGAIPVMAAAAGAVGGGPRRESLAGVDNDVAFATQDQRVLLRKNSVITMSKVYEEVYKQLHSTDAWVNKLMGEDDDDDSEVIFTEESIHDRHVRYPGVKSGLGAMAAPPFPTAGAAAGGGGVGGSPGPAASGVGGRRRSSLHQSSQLIDSISRRYIDSKLTRHGSISAGGGGGGASGRIGSPPTALAGVAGAGGSPGSGASAAVGSAGPMLRKASMAHRRTSNSHAHSHPHSVKGGSSNNDLMQALLSQHLSAATSAGGGGGGGGGTQQQSPTGRQQRYSLDSHSPSSKRGPSAAAGSRRPFSSRPAMGTPDADECAEGGAHAMGEDDDDDDDDILSLAHTPFNNSANAATATLELGMALQQGRDGKFRKPLFPKPKLDSAASALSGGGAGSLKLLGKAKLTYKEAMEG